MLALYTERLSVAPGETFAIHASSDAPDCTLEIARVGADRDVIHRAALTVNFHATPDDADAKGCGWPVAVNVAAGSDWRSGYYDIVLKNSSEEAHHFVCVRAGEKRQRMVLVLATNTLHAYNYWGGASAYCHVESLMRREKSLADAMAGAIGMLSTQRPFPPLLLAPPPDMPRLVTLRPRDFEERTWASGDPSWSRAHRQSPYDGSAGYLNKWEHAFVRWAEGEEKLAFDYLTDFDLDRDPHALDGYDVAVMVGHSEYWSGPQRDGIEAFVDRGGCLAIFSGNTAFWKVRWEDGGKTMVCRKWKGESDTAADRDKTHLWSHPMFARPEAAITGLSFLYGGYHRLGLCAARGAGGYTIYRDKHWALEGTDLFYGDVIGAGVPLIGYENDGCPIRFDADGLPAPDGGVGVPENLEIIGFAPAVFAESPDNPYRPLIPPEQMDVVARIAYGDASAKTQARVSRGHAVMASFTRGKGAVFNAGTTEWAHGLAANDPFVTRITRNVLNRFVNERAGP